MTDINPPPPSSDSDSTERLLIILCHLSLLFGVGLLLPLVVYLVKSPEVSRTAEHAKEALNFHISVYIYGFVSGLLCFVLIGIPMLIILAIVSIVCAIIASVKASEGQFYRYPFTIRLV